MEQGDISMLKETGNYSQRKKCKLRRWYLKGKQRIKTFPEL